MIGFKNKEKNILKTLRLFLRFWFSSFKGELK